MIQFLYTKTGRPVAVPSFKLDPAPLKGVNIPKNIDDLTDGKLAGSP
jgi:hypothetical protein